MALKIMKDTIDNQVILELSGAVDEDANLPLSVFGESKKIVLDLNGVETINSCGIREWVKWIAMTPKDSLLIYKNCQRQIVDQLNMVEGFIPENGRVDSFYVPYFCEDCELMSTLLMTRDKDYSDGNIEAKTDNQCEKCKNPVELDVSATKYFSFLNPATD